ncbi:zonular occludens toxin domain-containing protein [Chloroflexota bacterium]
MLTLIPGRQIWHAVDGDQSFPLRLGYLNAYDKLPPVDETFDRLQAAGLDGEHVIEGLVKAYLGYALFRTGIFKNREVVIGFIGARGSGKSCGAAMVAVIDFLLRGIPVWSNMNVTCRVAYKGAEKIYTTEPLDKRAIFNPANMYHEGCLLIDEINMEVADSLRSNSRTSLAFANVLQQIRHRGLSLMYTVQAERWITNRVRFGTDLYTWCNDAAIGLSNGNRGVKSQWRIFDYSGIITGKEFITGAQPISRKTVWIRPFWKLYDTMELQGVDTEVPEVTYSLDPIKLEKLKDEKKATLIAELILNYAAENNLTEVDDQDVWAMVDVDWNRSLQTRVGMILKGEGITKKRRNNGGYKYLFPTVEKII